MPTCIHYIGKFGKCELSDIRGYAELPDTQVLSGSETGNLLMWEGNFIKTEVFRKGKKRCHEGDITVSDSLVTELNGA